MFAAYPIMSLTFHKNFNVVYGVNGAGKSTILDAIAILLSWILWKKC
ncbi:MAG: ATP-binding protein [Planctomycetaceae bacterium]|nr:ATP-binding protein [Planctomycetaceae bacterium]